jgi:ribose-phosphate pyrophosphokinase
LIHAAETCRGAGAASVYAAVTHAPHAPGIAAVTADTNIAGVVTTDSIGYHFGPLPPDSAGKLTVLSIAPLFGEAIQRVLSGEPLAPLLQRWPV